MVREHRPVASSQIRRVESSPAERRYLPEGWKVRDWTQSSWPLWVGVSVVCEWEGWETYECPETDSTESVPEFDSLISRSSHHERNRQCIDILDIRWLHGVKYYID